MEVMKWLVGLAAGVLAILLIATVPDLDREIAPDRREDVPKKVDQHVVAPPAGIQTATVRPASPDSTGTTALPPTSPAPPPELPSAVDAALRSLQSFRSCRGVPRELDAKEPWALEFLPYDRPAADSLFGACATVSEDFATVRSDVYRLLSDERTATFGLEALVEELSMTMPDARGPEDLHAAEEGIDALLGGTPDQELRGLMYRAVLSEGVGELRWVASLLQLRVRLAELGQDDPTLGASREMYELEYMLDYEIDPAVRRQAQDLINSDGF